MPGPTWLQANAVLGEADDGDGRLFGAVFELAEHLERHGQLEEFHFMRKPPGLRLRFALAGDNRVAGREIAGCMDRLASQGIVTRWFPSAYEAETFKFGGTDAIAAAHAHFTADSKAWWAWDRWQRAASPSIDSRLLSVCVLNDLFVRVLEGPEEVWDVWCHVARLHGETPPAEGTPRPPAVRIDDVMDRMAPTEQAILSDYGRANGLLAQRFSELHAEGRLLYRYRLVLPHVALYHWNRYGFSPGDRALMYTAMVRAWSPHP